MPRQTQKDKKEKVETAENWLKFLGTAGARFVMIKQLRSSGGVWLHSKETNILIDPGPGSLVRCAASKPKLDPTQLDAIILTHRHLDHSNDINVMIEAMTEGGFKKRGLVFLPSDVIDKDCLILPHLKNFPEEIVRLKEGASYRIKDVEFSTPVRHIHTVETYGLKFDTFGGVLLRQAQDTSPKDTEQCRSETPPFRAGETYAALSINPEQSRRIDFEKCSLSFITDTKYFKDLEKYYKSDIIVINIVFYEHREGIDHLCLEETKNIIKAIKPKTAIITHFGMSMVRAKPHELAQELTKELGIEVLAAYDGMRFELGNNRS